jgi:pilus assembly protein CpaE
MSDHGKRDSGTIEEFDLDLELDMDAPLGAAFAAAVRGPASDNPEASVSLSDTPRADRATAWKESDPWRSFASETPSTLPAGDGGSFVDRLLSMDADDEDLDGAEPEAFTDTADEWASADEGYVDPDFAEPEFSEPAFEVFHDDQHEPVEAPAEAAQSLDVFSAVNSVAGARRPDVVSEIAPPPPVMEEEEAELATDASALDYGFTSTSSGGDRLIPRIAIHAFCTKTPLLGVMRQLTRDRRMKNVTMDVFEGGVKAAIQHYASETTPNLLLLEGAGDPMRLLQELDALAEYCDENIRVVIIGETNDIRLYRELMRRGVSEYLVAPVDPVQLIRAISGLFTDPDAPFMGKTLAVTGVLGGVGSSSIAHNLAWALSERIKVNATLVDLDLNFGTTGLDFNQDPAATIADALMSPERFDEAVMGRLITRATDRLSLFAAPATLDRTYDLDPDTYSHVLELVRTSVPFVVLDMPHIWSDWFKSTIVGADEVVVVAQPDLASLRNGKNLIDFLKAARPNDAPPKLILNMAGVPKRPEIPAKDFGQAMGLQPTLVLPFEPQVFGTAANNGQMIFDVAGESKCAQAIDQLATMLTGKELQTTKPSLLKKILLGK